MVHGYTIYVGANKDTLSSDCFSVEMFWVFHVKAQLVSPFLLNFSTQRFQGGFHELVNDLERDRFKQLVLDWLNQHTP